MAKPRVQVAGATKNKLTIVERKAPMFLETVTKKVNSNGVEFVSTPVGAVYARIDEIQPGLCTPVLLSNGVKGDEPMLALNRCTKDEIRDFITAERKATGWSISEIRDFYQI